MRLLGTCASADLLRLACDKSCSRLSAGFWCVCLERFISQNTSGKYSSVWRLRECAGKSEDRAMLTVIGSLKSVSLLSVRYSMFPSLYWLLLIKSSGLDRKEPYTSEKYGLLTG